MPIRWMVRSEPDARQAAGPEEAAPRVASPPGADDAAEPPEGTVWAEGGRRYVLTHVANQAAVLKYFAKYRRRTAADHAQALTRTAEEVRTLPERVNALDPASVGVRGSAMGLEGQAASLYRRRLGTLLPEGLGFGDRMTTSAQDSFNQCLNYVYGILYCEVWQAVVKAGLDPYFGLTHGSVRDQGSLVFDLIEEFRAPFADRVVVGMIGRGFNRRSGPAGCCERPRSAGSSGGSPDTGLHPPVPVGAPAASRPPVSWRCRHGGWGRCSGARRLLRQPPRLR